MSSESRFYLPDRTLSEEELLEIIDLQEKRDYSVRTEHSNAEKAQTAGKEKAYLEVSAKAIIHKVYEMEEGSLALTEMNLLDDGETELLFDAGDFLFSVYFSDSDVPERILLSKKDMDAHKNDVEIEKLSWEALSKQVDQRVQLFTGETICRKSAYSLMNGKKSAKGTISFYCELSDGTGCVAVYSMALKEVYDIYTESLDSMKKDIADRKDRAGDAGYSYKLLKKWGNHPVQSENAGWHIEGNTVFYESEENHGMQIHPASDGWSDLSVVDSDTVYVAYFSLEDGMIKVDKTCDRGKTWTASEISYQKYGGIGTVHVSFFDKNRGYVLYCSDPGAGSEKEVLFYTDDGAETFHLVKNLSDKVENYVSDMAFLNQDMGIILVSYHGSDVYAYRTEDGGVHWKPFQVELHGKRNYVNGISINRRDRADVWTLCLQMVADDGNQELCFFSKDAWKSWIAK